MQTYRLDADLSTGLNDGSSWANAYQSMADCIAAAAVSAGDTLRCTGTDTLAATQTWFVSGTTGGVIVTIIADDGADNYTRGGYIMDGNSAATNCLALGAHDYIDIKGIRFINATGDGVLGSSGNKGISFTECDFDSNGGIGSNVPGFATIYTNSRFRNNTGDGFTISSSSGFVVKGGMCTGNGGYGSYGSPVSMNISGMIFANNTNDDIWSNDDLAFISDCSFYSGGASAITIIKFTYISGCLFEDYDSDYAIDVSGSTDHCFLYKCGFFSNGGGDVNGNVIEISPNITLSSSPFIDAAGGDFQIDVGDSEVSGLETVYDTNNSSYIYLGALVPESPSANTPTFAGITACQPDSKGNIHIEWSAGTGVDYYIIFISSSALTYAASEMYCSRHNTQTKLIISSEADGTPLINNTTYNVGVRAYKYGAVANESNTVVMSVAPKGISGTFIVRQVAG